MKSKILVLHPNPSKVEAIIAKANLQNSKNGPFEAVLFLGSIPANAPETKPDVPIYFCGSTDKEGSLVDVAENYICVQAPWTVVKLQSGITIGFFPDSKSEEVPETKVDVLVSFHWAYSVARTQQLTLVGNQKVDTIVKSTEPRYHFAVGTDNGRFYEHPAFAWNNTRGSRFISLGQEGSGSKWFYAFGISTEEESVGVVGPNPFEERKRAHESDDEPEHNETAVTRLEGLAGDDNEERVKRPKVVAPDQCFFCLSNANVESHMIVAIGTYSYLTVAKGPLSVPGKGLNFSGHAIIIPIDHEPTLPLIEDSPQRKEILQFQDSLSSAFQAASFGVVFYEISRPENVHFHVQMVPVPLHDAQEQFERSLTEKTRQNNKFERNLLLEFSKYTDEDPELHKILETGNYLRFIVHSKGGKSQYVAALSSLKPVDLQFPRRVMAFHLRCPKRTYWDRCRQTVEEETKESRSFKKFYSEYDFTSK